MSFEAVSGRHVDHLLFIGHRSTMPQDVTLARVDRRFWRYSLRRRVGAMECLGVLTEESSTEGFCELGDACTALALLSEDYQAYRRAHPNRVGGGETGGEG